MVVKGGREGWMVSSGDNSRRSEEKWAVKDSVILQRPLLVIPR